MTDPPEVRMTTCVLELKDGGLRRVTVPSAWKVTFGPLAPANKGGNGGLCLRMYEDNTRQRAIFTDVRTFRDASIPIEERVTKTDEQVVWQETPEGREAIRQWLVTHL